MRLSYPCSRIFAQIVISSATFSFALSCAGARVSDRQPYVVIGPPVQELPQLFQQPEKWIQTRAHTSAILTWDHLLAKWGDDDLRDSFAKMRLWNLDLQLEVGAIKEWGTTGAKTFAAGDPKWRRFQRLGAPLSSLAMDEPLIASRHLNLGLPYTVQETANFIAYVRKNYPDVQIGDIEAYPSIELRDHYVWLDALQQRLRAMNARGLDFYRLDVDWMNFVVRNNGSWQEVRQLEEFCHSRKLRFDLIYWAADYPSLRQKGVANDKTWYDGVMFQTNGYRNVGGTPDTVVVESWVNAPSRAVPENDCTTFTGSVFELLRKLRAGAKLGI